MDLTLESSWRYKYFSGPISRTYQGHFGEILTCKQNNGYNCSLVGLGNPNKSELGIGSVLRSRYEWITQSSFRAQRVKLRYARPVAEECPAIMAREKFTK